MTTSAQTEKRPWHLAAQFDTVNQQIGTARMGMWLFLCAEVVAFAALLLVYFTIRHLHPEILAEGTALVNPLLGLVGTLSMITSSLTIALAVRAIQFGDKPAMQRFVVLTMGTAMALAAVIGMELVGFASRGLLPGENFGAGFELSTHANLYFAAFIAIGGVFLFHLVVGLLVLGWILARGTKGEFSCENFVAVENVSLYWHSLTIAWLFIFPLLYLVK